MSFNSIVEPNLQFSVKNNHLSLHIETNTKCLADSLGRQIQWKPQRAINKARASIRRIVTSHHTQQSKHENKVTRGFPTRKRRFDFDITRILHRSNSRYLVHRPLIA